MYGIDLSLSVYFLFRFWTFSCSQSRPTKTHSTLYTGPFIHGTTSCPKQHPSRMTHLWQLARRPFAASPHRSHGAPSAILEAWSAPMDWSTDPTDDVPSQYPCCRYQRRVLVVSACAPKIFKKYAHAHWYSRNRVIIMGLCIRFVNMAILGFQSGNSTSKHVCKCLQQV